MRSEITRKKVRAGDLVRISLKKKADLHHLLIFSSEGGSDLSPMILDYQMGDIKLPDDAPAERRFPILKPLNTRLSDNRPFDEFKFTAPYNSTIAVMEVVDGKDAVTAKARIRRYGKLEQKIRRVLGNLIRPVRNSSNSLQRT